MASTVPAVEVFVLKHASDGYEVRSEYFDPAPIPLESISAALLHCGQDIPVELTQFVNVHYGGACTGTISVLKLQTEASSITADLVATYAAMCESMEK